LGDQSTVGNLSVESLEPLASGSAGVRVDGCLGDSSKQNVEWLDVVVVEGAAVPAAHLLAAVAVVRRTGLCAVARRLPTAPALESGIAAQHRREDVVEVDVADDEQRPVPQLSTRPALHRVAFTLRTHNGLCTIQQTEMPEGTE